MAIRDNEKQENEMMLCDNWNIVGNVKRFISEEKKYKEAYRKLLLPLRSIFHDGSKRVSKIESLDNQLEGALIQRIENEEDFYFYLKQSQKLLSTIESIIPYNNIFYSVLDSLKSTKPTPYYMSCICYHSAIMIVCEFVHLHRIPDKFIFAYELVRKADTHLKLGVIHYIKILKNLVAHSIIDWAHKGINELTKIIGKNRKYLKGKNAKQALYALEVSIPFAKHAYKFNCNKDCSDKSTHKANGKILDRLNPKTINISSRFEITNGYFELPLGFKGYVADYNEVNRVVVGFRGSVNGWNYVTDVFQHVVGTSVVYKMALGLLITLKEIHDKQQCFWVLGHSLGGGLAQFAAVGMNSDNFVAFGYNSAGLSKTNKSILKKYSSDNVFHLHLKKDKVFLYGYQLGHYINQTVEVNDYCKAHELCTMCKERKVNVDSTLRVI